MMEPIPAVPRRLFETTEGDLYRWQREALTDLLAFIDAHHPNTRHPLPVIPWTLSVRHTVTARLSEYTPGPTGLRGDFLAVLTAYAQVLGEPVKELRLSGKTRHSVRGRIGRREGAKREPRTTVYIEADVWDEDDPGQDGTQQ